MSFVLFLKKDFLLFIILSSGLVLTGCNSEIKSDVISYSSKRSIYSWNDELFSYDKGKVFDILKENQISRVYQGIYTKEFDDIHFAEKIKRIKENIEICYLIGDPSWEDSDTVIRWAVEPLVRYNKSVGKESRITSVCLDIEYFNKHQFITADKYIRMISGIYAYCKKNNIWVITCVPYWLPDKIGLNNFRDLLCFTDEISCTVFLVGSELDIFNTCQQLCIDSKTKVEAVIEIQPENEQYDVKKINTYHDLGFERIKLEIEKLNDNGIDVGIHHLSEFIRFNDIEGVNYVFQ